MAMIGDQGLGETLGPSFDNQLAKPCDKSIAILIVEEYRALFDPLAMIGYPAPDASILAC